MSPAKARWSLTDLILPRITVHTCNCTQPHVRLLSCCRFFVTLVAIAMSCWICKFCSRRHSRSKYQPQHRPFKPFWLLRWQCCVTCGDKRKQQPVFVTSTVPFFSSFQNSHSGSNKLFSSGCLLLECSRTFSKAQYQMPVRIFKNLQTKFVWRLTIWVTYRIANFCTVVSNLQLSFF
jgi:hypothetical protein